MRDHLAGVRPAVGANLSLEILDRVGAARGNWFFVRSGGVYRVLRTLEEDGLLSSFDVPAPIDVRHGERPRRYYELTEHGLAKRYIINGGRFL